MLLFSVDKVPVWHSKTTSQFLTHHICVSIKADVSNHKKSHQCGIQSRCVKSQHITSMSQSKPSFQFLRRQCFNQNTIPSTKQTSIRSFSSLHDFLLSVPISKTNTPLKYRTYFSPGMAPLVNTEICKYRQLRVKSLEKVLFTTL